MNCCVTDLRNKEVINQKDGCRLGNVCDVEVDTCSGRVVALIIFGRSRCMGLLGRDDDIRICWEDIKVIGDDTVLVCYNSSCCPPRQRRKSSSFSDILSSI